MSVNDRQILILGTQEETIDLIKELNKSISNKNINLQGLEPISSITQTEDGKITITPTPNVDKTVAEQNFFKFMRALRKLTSIQKARLKD